MFGILHKVAYFFTILCLLLLLGSIAAPYISPDEWIIPAYLGIAFPFLYIANIIWLLYWAFFLKLRFIFPLAGLILGFYHTGKVLKIWNGNILTLKKSTQSFKIISFNTKLFGVADKRVDTGPFFQRLSEESPDIICFQEFMWEETKRRNYIQKTIKTTGAKYYRFSRAYQAMDSLHRDYGIMIFTKFPIIAEGELKFAQRSTNRCLWVDVVTDLDTFRIFNIHLQSYRFGKNEYNLVQEGQGQETDLIFKRGVGLFTKMSYAWKIRAKQAQEVAELVQNSPHPILLCGDFNDTPISFAYQILSNGFLDAFREAGTGVGATYLGPMPNFRIDYILTSPKFNVQEFALWDKSLSTFSDHRILMSRVIYNVQANPNEPN